MCAEVRAGVDGDALVDELRRHALGGPPPPALDEILRTAALTDPTATVTDSARAAIEIAALIDDDVDIDVATFTVIELPEPPPAALEPPSDDPGGGDVPRPPSLDMEQDDDQRQQGGQIVELLAPDPGRPEAETERPPGHRPGDRVGGSDDDGDARMFWYDEWSYVDRRYLRAWCRVVERRLHGDDPSFIADVRRRHAVLASRVRRQFSFVRPEGGCACTTPTTVTSSTSMR